MVANILNDNSKGLEISLSEGVGDKININEPFILVSQHPVTTEYGAGEKQIAMTLEAVRKTGLPVIVLLDAKPLTIFFAVKTVAAVLADKIAVSADG